MDPDLETRPKVFLSYARRDGDTFVPTLRDHLTAAGFDVWWDSTSMQSRGRTFLQELRDAIEGVDRLVAIVDQRALRSDYVRAEWDHARLFAKGVVPVLREGSFDDPPGDLPREYTLRTGVVMTTEPEPTSAAFSELVRYLSAPVPTLAETAGVPELPPRFVARPDDLAGLRDHVLGDVVQPIVLSDPYRRFTVVHGMGGIGKSVLAAAFCRSTDTRIAFADGIVWHRVGRDAGALTVLRSLGRALGDSGTYRDRSEATVRLDQLLAGRQCLIVFDDVWNADVLTPVLNAASPQSRFVVTTRNADILRGANLYAVPMLSPLTARRLLSDWSGEAVEDILPDGDVVAEECGYLPFALALSGAMREGGTPWAEIIAALRAAQLDFAERVFPNYEQYATLLKSLQASVDFLVGDDVAALARYRELGVFAHSPRVPERAVITLWTATSGAEERDVRKTLGALARKALLFLEGEAPERIVTLHDLQRDYLTYTTSDSDRRRLHATLIEAYRTRCPDGWWDGPNDGYFHQSLAWHLGEAGAIAELASTLTDFRWLNARLLATDSYALLDDYRLWSDTGDGNGYSDRDNDEDEAIRLIHRALLQSVQILDRDEGQLRSQLLGRLLSSTNPRIRAFLASVPSQSGAVWLRPLGPSLSTGSLRFTLRGHAGTVRRVAIDGSSWFCATSGNSSPDQTIRLWDLRSGQQLHELRDQAEAGGATPLAFTHDSRQLVSGFGTRLRIWNLASGELERDIGSHPETVMACAAAAAHPTLVSADAGGGLRTWNTSSWTLREELAIGDRIHGVAVTADGTVVVAATQTALVRWNVDSSGATERIDAPLGEPFGWQDMPLAFTEHDRRIVFGTEFRRWDTATDTLSAPADSLPWRAGLALSRSGGRAVCAAAIDAYRDRAMSPTDVEWLEVWDLGSEACLLRVPPQGSMLAAVAIADDGNTLVSTYMDHTVRVWDVGPVALPDHRTHDNAITLVKLVEPDGHASRLALTVDQGNQVRAWDLDTGAEVEESEETQELMQPFWSGGEHESDATAPTLDVLPAPPRPRDRRGSPIPARPGDWSWAIAPNRTRAVRFSPQRKKVSEEPDPPDADDEARLIPAEVWDIGVGEPTRRHPSRAHDHRLRGFVVTPGGRQAISYGFGSLRQWDLESGEQIRRLEGHEGPIWCATISNDGAWLLSGSEDSTLRLWNLATGKNVTTFTGESPIKACALDDVGGSRLVAVAGEDSGRVHVLELVVDER